MWLNPPASDPALDFSNNAVSTVYIYQFALGSYLLSLYLFLIATVRIRRK